MPMGKRVINNLLKELNQYQPQGLCLELGSGWGGLAISLATCYPRLSVMGLEVSPSLFTLVSFINYYLEKKSRIFHLKKLIFLKLL